MRGQSQILQDLVGNRRMHQKQSVDERQLSQIVQNVR